MNIQWVGSCNYDKGRFGHVISRVAIHIMEGTLAGCDAWFNNKASEASAHYGIGKDGTIHQYVHDEDNAWGVTLYNPTSPYVFPAPLNPNFYTLNIEFEGHSGDQFTDAQINAFVWLYQQKNCIWNITLDRIHILGHCEYNSVTRKGCPGINLDQFVATVKARMPQPKPNLSLTQQQMDQIKTLQTEVTTLQTQISGLQGQNQQKDTEITDSSSEIAQLQAQITDLQNQINLKNTLISSLQVQLNDYTAKTEEAQQFNLLIYLYGLLKKMWTRN